jgi:hypothetical protein
VTEDEIERRLAAVLDEAAPNHRERAGRSDEIGLRVIDVGGELLVHARVPDRAEHGRFLIGIRRQFGDVAVQLQTGGRP